MKHKSQSGFAHVGVVLLLVLVFAIIGGGGYYVWQKNKDKNAETSQQTKDSSKDTNSDIPMDDGWSDPIDSGKGAYSVSFPDGWNILKDTSSDSFMIGGETQPVTAAGKATKVTSTAFGSDGPIVLFITAQDRSDAIPQGTATDFTLQNGKENPIQGKKYSYEYVADSTGEGLGAEHIKGDRDYTFVFNIDDNKELRIMYSVYGSDPRNLINTIDELVNTIKLKQ